MASVYSTDPTIGHIRKKRRRSRGDLAWGMGRVTSRGARFQARWVEQGENGFPVERAKSFDSRREAEDWLRAISRSRIDETLEHVKPAYEENLVYFVQAVEGGPIKIGHAKDPEARLVIMQLGCPIELRLLAITEGGKARESALHAAFSGLRLHGEWFQPDSALLLWIEEHATPVRPK